MSLQLQGYIDMPEHQQDGGFDHAAVHLAKHLLYVAHTSNDALDVIDCASDRYLRSIPNLTGVAGALVSEERNLIFTSNRGEDTVSIFSPDDDAGATKISVGIRPNGLSFDPKRGHLLAANVGNPEIPNSFTVSIVDVERHEMIHSIPVPGRTCWTIFDSNSDCFYVNIADPFEIVVIESANPTRVARSMAIPAKGPHGLDLDPASNQLFCACDAGRLFALDASTGKIQREAELSGTPDVIFYNAALQHLYVAIGDPGVIDVFDTTKLRKLETVKTERGAHTIAFDAEHNKVYAFLPKTHRAMTLLDA
ncbi:MAG: YncE family protein [Anaerolineales bacterium]|nr:MAG: YncE family protein [Anaerolineales bacterium]